MKMFSQGRLFLVVFGALLLAGIGMRGHAQAVDTIAPGERKTGTLTATVPAVSYFFTLDAPATLTATITPGEGFRPVLLVATDANQLIDTFTAAADATVLRATIRFETAGRYYLQVQGAAGSRGSFTLELSEGEPTATSTSTPPATASATAAATAQPSSMERTATAFIAGVTATCFAATSTADARETAGPPCCATAASPADALLPGDLVRGTVDAERPTAIYTLQADDAAVYLLVEGAVDIELIDDASGALLARFTGGGGGAYLTRPVEARYRLFVQLPAETASAEYAIAALLVEGALLGAVVALPDGEVALAGTLSPEPESGTLPPTPTPAAPTATATPTPSATPAVVDVRIDWDATQMVLTNVSGRQLDLSTLVLAGNNRRVGTDYWEFGNPAFDAAVFNPTACGGFRPLAYPDAPALPAGCTTLAGWWSADIVYVWGSESFDVLLNGQVVATCQSEAGTCGFAVP
jgi:hypothetical protein